MADGGSVDATRELASEWADRVIQTQAGRARQMNAGAEAARGDVLWFVHADTLAPEAAARAIERAIRDDALWGHFDIRLSGDRMAFRIIESAVNRRSRLSGIATGDQGIFVRRDEFRRLGGFPDMPLMEDLAMSRMLKRQGRPVCLKPALLTSSRRWERQGIARTVWLMWRLRLAFWLGADHERLARRYGNGGGG